MIETVRELISTDSRMTLRMMEEELEISRETIRKILLENLGKRKISARFVPHCLADEQKTLRLQASQGPIRFVYDDRSLLDSTVTGDETWCFQYDPPPPKKIQSMEWLSPSSPRHKDCRFKKSRNKVILVTFYYSQGIIHKEFIPPGQMVNKVLVYYVEVLSRLVQRIRRVRPQFQERGSWFLLHDTARPHTAVSVKQFLANKGFQN
jgi:hypothetical protein